MNLETQLKRQPLFWIWGIQMPRPPRKLRHPWDAIGAEVIGLETGGFLVKWDQRVYSVPGVTAKQIGPPQTGAGVLGPRRDRNRLPAHSGGRRLCRRGLDPAQFNRTALLGGLRCAFFGDSSAGGCLRHHHGSTSRAGIGAVVPQLDRAWPSRSKSGDHSRATQTLQFHTDWTLTGFAEPGLGDCGRQLHPVQRHFRF